MFKSPQAMKDAFKIAVDKSHRCSQAVELDPYDTEQTDALLEAFAEVCEAAEALKEALHRTPAQCCAYAASKHLKQWLRSVGAGLDLEDTSKRFMYRIQEGTWGRVSGLADIDGVLLFGRHLPSDAQILRAAEFHYWTPGDDQS